jgi:DNA-binding NtrC family response regulator
MPVYRILLVDDEQYILKTLGPSLETQGWNVMTVDNGEKAIELIDKEHFDLVITDLVMGDADGIAVLKAIRASHPDMMVMILTGYGDLRSAIDALRLDADDYLLKPCEVEEVFFRVRRCFAELELKRKVRLYESLLPVCCVCKRVRDDSGRAPGTGEWLRIEDYFHFKAGILVTSGYCPECAMKMEQDVEKYRKDR